MTQAELDRYVQLKSEIALREAECKPLNDKFKEWLIAGNKCPDGGAFIVTLGYQERQQISWEDICKHIISVLPSEWQRKVQTAVNRLAGRKKRVPTLTIQRNHAAISTGLVA